MKKRLFGLLAALCLCFSLILSPAAAAETTEGDALYEKFETVMEIIRQYGLYSSEGDDLLKTLLIDLFNEDPELFDQLADRMLKTHDSRSGYFPAEVYDMAFPTQQSYAGVGVSIEATPEGFAITGITKGGPAEGSGLAPGDILTHVDNADVSQLDAEGLIAKVRGEPGTKVALTVRRGGGSYTYTLTRAVIGISNFSWEMKEPGIAYMRFTRFETVSAYMEFWAAWQTLFENEVKALIMDFRGNPGGSLALAEELLQDIIPAKDVQFAGYQMREDRGGFIAATSVGRGVPLNKIVILVDGHSASASELIAGSLRDLGYAELVGTTTYGKATGQYHLELEDGSSVVITGLSIVLPGGKAYDGIGLTPDHYVENKMAAPSLPDLLPLDITKEVYLTNFSEQTRALNQRLALLGALDKPEHTYGVFDQKTLDALHLFQTARGYPRTAYASSAALREIEEAVNALAATPALRDYQMEKAMELARSVLGEELPYTLDAFGNPVAK